MTIQFKLTMIVIAVIVVVNSAVSYVAVQYAGTVWLDEVQTRVRLDLNSARAAYRNHKDTILAFLHATSLDPHLAKGVEENDMAGVEDLVRRAHQKGGADIISLLDATGKVIYRARNPGTKGDSLAHNPIVAQVLREQRLARGTIVLSQESLLAEGKDLAERAHLRLIDTPNARPTKDEFRSEGMLAGVAIPILDPQKKMVAILYGGDLLNQRFEIVDAIKDEVFPKQVYQGRDIGTVTIFQGDLRIATNVTMADGQRAVGTRLSAPVAERVLDRGEPWAAPAFVVNDWYITAYEPITDPDGQIIGVLYVGLLRAPFAQRHLLLVGGFLALVLLATVASLLLIVVVTKLVLRPLVHIIAMQRKVAAGDLAARVAVAASGEMGELCREINQMAAALQERERQLEQATRRQIGRSEQLASVGRLAAGVAHEINNPLTGVLTFACMLREKENMDPQDRQDLDLIVRETTRAAGIVRGLLDFARERPSAKAPMDVNDVIRRTMRLLGNQSAFHNIVVVEDLADGLPAIDGDANQIQQVFLNLSLNACEAMPEGGTLLLSTSCENESVVVRVTDTGCGIKREHLDQIFEPFFTTKPVGKGTGLGLSVSYGIVRQHGGTLEVESAAGKGSTFAATFPALTNASPGGPGKAPPDA